VGRTAGLATHQRPRGVDNAGLDRGLSPAAELIRYLARTRAAHRCRRPSLPIRRRCGSDSRPGRHRRRPDGEGGVPGRRRFGRTFLALRIASLREGPPQSGARRAGAWSRYAHRPRRPAVATPSSAKVLWFSAAGEAEKSHFAPARHRRGTLDAARYKAIRRRRTVRHPKRQSPRAQGNHSFANSTQSRASVPPRFLQERVSESMSVLEERQSTGYTVQY
jgi:hypothetical protein